MCRIVSCFGRQLLLHALSSSKRVAPNLYDLVDNNNVHQIVFGDNNINSFLCIMGEKVGNLFLYVNSTFNTIATTISQSISWATMCSLLHGQCNKWIPKSLMV